MCTKMIKENCVDYDEKHSLSAAFLLGIVAFQFRACAKASFSSRV